MSRLLEGEREKLLRLDEILHERVIGQDEAVQLVTDAIIPARSAIKDPHRPIGRPSSSARAARSSPMLGSLVMSEWQRHFRPEFLNRVDDIVAFKSLTEQEIEQIVELMLNELGARLADRRITLEVTDAARRFMAEQGHDPIYGARPLRRFIAREVEIRIGRALLGGDVRDGATIHIDLRQGELVVTYHNPPAASAA